MSIYGLFQDDSTQNQKNSLQNGETPAKVEIKEENAENKSVAETAETSPPTENGKNESGSAPDENGKENQVCTIFRTPCPRYFVGHPSKYNGPIKIDSLHGWIHDWVGGDPWPLDRLKK